MKAGKWQIGVGQSVGGKTLGIYGYGRIGAVVAGYGKAFGMKVLVWAREKALAKARADGYATAASKAEFFEQCDVLSLAHAPGRCHARHRQSGGPRADEADRAAGQYQPRAADRAERAGECAARRTARDGSGGRLRERTACDVNDPLLNLPNAICTPHIGYVTRDEYQLQFTDIFDQIVAYAAGTPTNVVNPDVMAKRR